MLTHARALLADETTIAVPVDARDPAAILANPAVRAHLDFEKPVAVLLVSVLHFLDGPDDDLPAVVGGFRDALVPGSFVVISHVADLPDGPHSTERAKATREAAEQLVRNVPLVRLTGHGPHGPPLGADVAVYTL